MQSKTKFISKCLILLTLVISVVSCQDKLESNTILVSNSDELQDAIFKSKAGDNIVMSNGIWIDVQIKFYGKGTKEKPIVLKAETAGKVMIEGASDLKLGGDYLEVKDLYFKNGHTPSESIIRFKLNNDTIANHSRVTNCVIEEFTQPNREVTDHWIEFWGRNNQLDHCNIIGKSNFGPTVRVFLKGNEHINNHHQITNNYFGPRPRKGGPHGETIQIGDSYTSMTPSYTNVSNNYFEYCNGEVEVISNKSNFNEYRNNIFFESEGSLVLRHGNYCTIDGNVFIGNDNSEFIGGIRVINTGHWITNNYFYKLKGKEFRSALAVMNGIPKSPLNRYMQVTDVVVAYNTYIDCKSPFQFSVGANIDKKDVLPASEIRSARPERMVLANNLIYNHEVDNYPIVAYDKVDGVTFKKNIFNSENKSEVSNDGIIQRDFEVNKLSDYLYVPTKNQEDVYQGFDFEKISTDFFGADRLKQNSIGAITLPVKENPILINKKVYGTDWFSTNAPHYDSKKLEVATNKELVDKLKNAHSGDILSLKSGVYEMDASLVIDKNITITSADKKNKAELQFTGEKAAFKMHPKGVLNLESVNLKGDKTQDAFTTLDKNMSKAYDLFLKNSEISNFKSVIKVYKASFADTISVDNCVIKNCLRGIELNKETDAKGDYNAEFVYIMNSQFDNIQSTVLDYYRGGYDESTIGGNLVLQHNTFTNCSKADKSGILIQNHGIVNVDFSNNIFKNNPVKTVAILWGEKGQKPVNNTVVNSGDIKIEQNLKQKLMY
ncbi:chondroitinase-B domain-containing protein [Yeosuana marina]|uniref:chondroitinase-B domain-containing protein n=1 Tax=Yeosuana marina TaxID=1565536 RepID=UPI0014222A13|nr:chondroitinase-B domain-containing protein [Yeosuana marina]